MTSTQQQTYYRKREAAEYLRCSLRALTDLVKNRKIPFHRVGPHHVLFARDDLDAFLDTVRVNDAAQHEECSDE